MRARSRFVAALAVLGLLSGCTFAGDSGSTTGQRLTAATGEGIGDPYYPDDGNLGYEVTRYHVKLDYFPSTERIAADAVIASVAKRALRSFHLDLVGFRVTGVTVDGRAATWRRADAHELVITSDRLIRKGSSFVTVVSYRGKPGVDPLGSGVPSGWFDATTPGGGFIAGEPHSCTLWYPCNDHPTDKALFSVTATVPRPFDVVSVGSQGRTTLGTRAGSPVRTFRWHLREATATYLTTIYIDMLTFERSTLADGTPVISAYGPQPGDAPEREALLPEILRVLSARWGQYPAPQAGGIFVNGQVPFSLETFTRPIYTEGADIPTIVHENGHQWWGDNVTLKRWRDICLNECFASYSVWLWDEHRGVDLDARYRSGVERDTLFDAPLYDMGPGNEFDFGGVYLKGTYFLHALRAKLGSQVLFSSLRAIQREYAGANLSMLGLRNELESATGVDLTSFWDEWVLGVGVPSDANLHPGDL